MEIIETYSYRHAEAILTTTYRREKKEIIEVLQETTWVTYPEPKHRRRHGKIVATLTIDQPKTNRLIETAFQAKGWEVGPRIISESPSRLQSDFKKGEIQVEVQFGNMARWYTDVFKFLLSYSSGDIEIGVLVVPMQATAKQIDENVVYYERVVRELPHAKMGITLPIWIIGIGISN